MFEERYRNEMNRVRVDPSLLDKIKEQDAEATYRLWEQKRKKRSSILAWSTAGATVVAGLVLLVVAFPNVFGQKSVESDMVAEAVITEECEFELEIAVEAEGEISGDRGGLKISGELTSPNDYSELYREFTDRIGGGAVDVMLSPIQESTKTEQETADNGTSELELPSEYISDEAFRVAGGQIKGDPDTELALTDGSYRYCLDRDQNAVYIVQTDGGAMSKTDRIDLKKNSEAEYWYAHEMLLISDTLYVFMERSVRHEDFREDFTVVLAFDVSDPTDIKETTRFEQSGSYVALRRIGEHLCIISQTDGGSLFDRCDPKDPETLSPLVDGKPLLPDEILLSRTGTGTGYTVVTAIHTEKCERTEFRWAVLGENDALSCAETYLLPSVAE